MTNDLKTRLASFSDAKLLYRWANDSVTRNNSFNSEFIKWDDHLRWLNHKLFDPKTKIFIHSFGIIQIGTTRIEETAATIIGITVAPEYRGKGFGSLMIKRTCELYWGYCNKDIIAYVKNDNISSRKIFERAGFIYTNSTKINNINCLVLIARKNENKCD